MHALFQARYCFHSLLGEQVYVLCHCGRPRCVPRRRRGGRRGGAGPVAGPQCKTRGATQCLSGGPCSCALTGMAQQGVKHREFNDPSGVKRPAHSRDPDVGSGGVNGQSEVVKSPWSVSALSVRGRTALLQRSTSAGSPMAELEIQKHFCAALSGAPPAGGHTAPPLLPRGAAWTCSSGCSIIGLIGIHWGEGLGKGGGGNSCGATPPLTESVRP
jgi:hypothetical protein